MEYDVGLPLWAAGIGAWSLDRALGLALAGSVWSLIFTVAGVAAALGLWATRDRRGPALQGGAV